MRILVTGGAGYIGSLTARHLASTGHDPVVLDDLRSGHRAAVGGLPLVVGDVRDVDLVASTIERHAIDAVIHFAALKSVEDSVKDPGGYFENNVGGTLSVLRAMVRMNVRRIVFSSSCAVYGMPDTLPVTEASPIRPMNPYGESKALAERMLPWFEAAEGIRFAALRYFNAAGAAEDGSVGEDWTQAQNLIPVVLRTAARRQPTVRIFGTDHPTPDGTAIRDYIHVLDLAEAHRCALEAIERGDTSLTVNVGTGVGVSVREVLDIARRVTGEAVPAEEAPRRVGDPPAVWADTTQAGELLGWRATRDLKDIIASAWLWHSRHPDGYADDLPGRPLEAVG
ncbi:MAG TPA: UDP-glucose 4-epimerase GalE [Candidatus Limnocylindrales bacterium]|nr:UDP-glucose 4-epimerase GalE [Candidatus Limnocylindrales bacterium]